MADSDSNSDCIECHAQSPAITPTVRVLGTDLYITSAVLIRNKGFVTGHLPRQVRLTEGVIRWLHDIMHASALC